MNQFMNNRYVQIGGLTLGLAILIYMVLWIIITVANLGEVPPFITVVISLGIATWLVWKFYAWRIG
ncbi:MAG: hypothetical protein WAU02_04210 [Candidatus Saccharimonadales bacterium]